MLNKNIYILFPPGYSGTYVHWAISKSEKDLSKTTVDDPINKKIDSNFGGLGTAHLHSRIPTHQNLQQHLCWLIRNRPTEKKIYILNAHQSQLPELTIDTILWYDPDPIFIYIHDGGDMDNRKYGALNTLFKWPVFFKANQQRQKLYKFDVSNLNNIETRNTFFKNFNSIFPHSTTLNYNLLDSRINWSYTWYKTRNEHNPHEVNESTYLVPKQERPIIFDTSLKDIVSNNFIQWLKNITCTDGLGDFDTSYIESYHENYINAQENLLWFTEIENFRNTYVLSDYFKSNVLLESYIMMELKEYFFNFSSWVNMSLEEIVEFSRSHWDFPLLKNT